MKQRIIDMLKQDIQQAQNYYINELRREHRTVGALARITAFIEAYNWVLEEIRMAERLDEEGNV